MAAASCQSSYFENETMSSASRFDRRIAFIDLNDLNYYNIMYPYVH